MDAVGHQAFTDCLDNGNPAGDCGFERHGYTLLLRGAEDFVTVNGNHGLVCRYDMFFVFNGLQNQVFCGGVTAYQFYDYFNVRIIDDGKSIIRNPVYLVQPLDCAGIVFFCRSMADDNFPAGPARDLVGVPGQYRDNAPAYRTQAEQPCFYRFHYPFFLSLFSRRFY